MGQNGSLCILHYIDAQSICISYANFCKRCYAEVNDKGHYLKKEPTVNFVDLIRNISRIQETIITSIFYLFFIFAILPEYKLLIILCACTLENCRVSKTNKVYHLQSKISRRSCSLVFNMNLLAMIQLIDKNTFHNQMICPSKKSPSNHTPVQARTTTLGTHLIEMNPRV